MIVIGWEKVYIFTRLQRPASIDALYRAVAQFGAEPKKRLLEQSNQGGESPFTESELSTISELEKKVAMILNRPATQQPFWKIR
jgi:hypothetical protein